MGEFKIRSLNSGDTTAVERLLNMNAKGTYPHELVSDLRFDELLATDSDWMADCSVVGAFRQDELLAAAKIGRNPTDGEPREMGNLLPGDGVIEWLLLSDEDAADELLDFAAPILGTRWYAFPDSGDLGRFAPFQTGMLPIQRKQITDFFEKRGWEQPVGEIWGPLERIGYRLDLTGPIDVSPLPPGLHVKHDSKRISAKSKAFSAWAALLGWALPGRFAPPSRSGRGKGSHRSRMRLRTGDGTRIGKCNVSSAKFRGDPLEDAIRVEWIGINEEWRRQGLARILLSMQMSRAQQMGIDRIYITTYVNLPARKLYESMGFREVMRMKSWVTKL